MVDIQLKVLDIQAGSPLKHSLYLKNDSDFIKKVWPNNQISVFSDTEANSLKFLLKLGSNPIGEVPLLDFTKEWTHSSKEIHGYRISIAYRIMLKRQGSQDFLVLQKNGFSNLN